ncbi:unnamed protein product [Anisakis simplex]|uniref:Uncharacterized protein n=1 Tax=Anisakis simplex TaxID=6269 RepID=A0A3P6NRQ6_ANISI|nr:unnamed protein product [Anisakis simplex]
MGFCTFDHHHHISQSTKAFFKSSSVISLALTTPDRSRPSTLAPETTILVESATFQLLVSLACVLALKISVQLTLEGCDAHQVHTFIPSHFKSRSKGQVACYSCLAYTREPSNHRIFELDPPTPANITDLYAVLRKGGMRIPVYAERCAETRAGMNPNFVGAKISICPNTDTEPGSCVKLKGRFNG